MEMLERVWETSTSSARKHAEASIRRVLKLTPSTAVQMMNSETIYATRQAPESRPYLSLPTIQKFLTFEISRGSRNFKMSGSSSRSNNEFHTPLEVTVKSALLSSAPILVVAPPSRPQPNSSAQNPHLKLFPTNPSNPPSNHSTPTTPSSMRLLFLQK
jgi:hypothetical protein